MSRVFGKLACPHCGNSDQEDFRVVVEVGDGERRDSVVSLLGYRCNQCLYVIPLEAIDGNAKDNASHRSSS